MKVTDLFQENGIRFVVDGEHHHARRGWIQVDCPYCSPSSDRFRLGYNLYGKYFSCWSCGPQRTYETLAELLGVKAGQARNLLKEVESDQRFKVDPKRGKLKIPDGLGPLTQPHKMYLRDRRLKPETIEEFWKIRGIGIHPTLSWRIFIPIEFDGSTVSWTTRSIGTASNTLRYLSAKPEEEKFSLKHLLYGEDYCTFNPAIIITEGPVDVWKIGPGAVSVLGLSYTSQQVLKMIRYRKRIICFDTDKEGKARAQRLANDLSAFPGKTIIVTLDAPDPASASDEEVMKLQRMIDN